MIANGTVTTKTDGSLWIRVQRPTACDKCGACGMGTAHELPMIQGDFAPGDAVIISWTEGSMLTASVMTYGMPLSGLLIGLMLGALLGGDLLAVTGCAIGLCLGCLALWVLNRSRWVRRMPKLHIEKFVDA